MLRELEYQAAWRSNSIVRSIYVQRELETLVGSVQVHWRMPSCATEAKPDRATERFRDLTSREKQQLIAFLNSL
jgi:hypothetical protein